MLNRTRNTHYAESGMVDRSVQVAVADLASTRTSTLEMVRGLSQDAFDRRPSSDKWSIGEVLDHLILIEGYQGNQVRELVGLARSGRPAFLWRSFSDVDMSIAFIPRPVLSLFEMPITLVGMFVPNTLREWVMQNRAIRAQHPSFSNPRPGRKVVELCSELSRSINQIKNIIMMNSDLDFQKMILQHPLWGIINVSGILRYLSRHEQGHQGQIRDILMELRRTR
jgi:DinB family protein